MDISLHEHNSKVDAKEVNLILSMIFINYQQYKSANWSILDETWKYVE